MKLNFHIKPNLIFYNSLLKGDKTKGWLDIQNQLWDEHRDAYKALKGDFSHPMTQYLEEGLTPIAKKMNTLIDEGMKTSKFKQLLKNTEKYKDWLEQEWKTKNKKINSELEDILKTKLPAKPFEVFVTSPTSKAGRYIGDHKIVFGHSEDWKNYSLVYIMHECLHELIGNGRLNHAVIELIADNELRIRLAGKGKYFKDRDTRIGHKDLIELEKSLLQEWWRYRTTDKYKDIFDFIKIQKTQMLN